MPSIIMSKPASKLDPAIKKKAFAFLEKLGDDDTTPGLHLEPIANSADPRVRTGRVDLAYRAVLFKVTQGPSVVYIFHGIWPHDEAIDVAQRTTLKLNPINGIAEIVTVPSTPPSTKPFELTGTAEPEPLPLTPALGPEPSPATEPDPATSAPTTPSPHHPPTTPHPTPLPAATTQAPTVTQ